MTQIVSALTIMFTVACCGPAAAQAQSATTLKVELQNAVEYQVDLSDHSKFGTDPNRTTGGLTPAGSLSDKIVGLADIVPVNGQPAKGTFISRGVGVCLSPTPVRGQPIADISRNTIRFE